MNGLRALLVVLSTAARGEPAASPAAEASIVPTPTWTVGRESVADPFQVYDDARRQNRPIAVGRDLVAECAGRLVGMQSAVIERGALRRELRAWLKPYRRRCQTLFVATGPADDAGRLFLAYLDVAAELAGLRDGPTRGTGWEREIARTVALVRKAKGAAASPLLSRTFDFSSLRAPAFLPREAADAWRARRWMSTPLAPSEEGPPRQRAGEALLFGAYAHRSKARFATALARLEKIRRRVETLGSPGVLVRDGESPSAAIPDGDPRRLPESERGLMARKLLAGMSSDESLLGHALPLEIAAPLPDDSGVLHLVAPPAPGPHLVLRFVALLAESYGYSDVRDAEAALAGACAAIGPLDGRRADLASPPSERRPKKKMGATLREMAKPPKAAGGELESAEVFYRALARFSTALAAEGTREGWMDREFARRFTLLSGLANRMCALGESARPGRAPSREESVQIWNLPSQLQSVSAPTAPLRPLAAAEWVCAFAPSGTARTFGPVRHHPLWRRGAKGTLTGIVAAAWIDGMPPSWLPPRP